MKKIFTASLTIAALTWAALPVLGQSDCDTAIQKSRTNLSYALSLDNFLRGESLIQEAIKAYELQKELMLSFIKACPEPVAVQEMQRQNGLIKEANDVLQYRIERGLL